MVSKAIANWIWRDLRERRPEGCYSKPQPPFRARKRIPQRTPPGTSKSGFGSSSRTPKVSLAASTTRSTTVTVARMHIRTGVSGAHLGLHADLDGAEVVDRDDDFHVQRVDLGQLGDGSVLGGFSGRHHALDDDAVDGTAHGTVFQDLLRPDPVPDARSSVVPRLAGAEAGRALRRWWPCPFR